MTPYRGTERRKFIRIKEEDLLICEPFDPALFGGAVEKRIRTYTKNLSEGGILFEIDQSYAIGSLLKLDIDIPGWERYKAEFYKADKLSGREPFVVLGKVVRLEDIGKGRFDVGVAFTAVDKGHRLALRKYLQHAVHTS